MVSFQINDTVAAALNARAAAQGLTIEAYLESIVLSGSSPGKPRLSPDQLDRLLDEEATNGPSPTGSFSRADLYRGHD